MPHSYAFYFDCDPISFYFLLIVIVGVGTTIPFVLLHHNPTTPRLGIPKTRRNTPHASACPAHGLIVPPPSVWRAYTC